MCYHPITIINPSKYVSLRYRDRYLLRVPCGHCAECLTNKANEWYYRCYYHSLDCLSRSGNAYIIFDTLTYDNKSLPHLSDFMPTPKDCDYPCFNHRHIQLFNKRLRKLCDKYGSKYSFFVTCEYGTADEYTVNGYRKRATHRPHYHILLYCDGKIDKIMMSHYIANAWSYGRTDGIDYQPYYHVLHNMFDSSQFADSLRTCRYVSKYIRKSCKFQRELNKRLDHVMLSIGERMPEGWLETVHAKRLRMRYSCLVNQFHRQSLGFGAAALADMDLNALIKTGVVTMPDSRKVQLVVPLPTYFKRKLFYQTIRIDGADVWIPTELGVKYLIAREYEQRKNLIARYTAANHTFKTNFDPVKLANYVIDYQGRIRAKNKSDDPLYKFNYPDLFNYSTQSDKQVLDKLGLSKRFIGNVHLGYRTSKLLPRIKFLDFIAQYVYHDPMLENQIQYFDRCYERVNDKRQEAFELTQRLTNLYHYLGVG